MWCLSFWWIYDPSIGQVSLTRNWPWNLRRRYVIHTHKRTKQHKHKTYSNGRSRYTKYPDNYLFIICQFLNFFEILSLTIRRPHMFMLLLWTKRELSLIPHSLFGNHNTKFIIKLWEQDYESVVYHNNI